MPQKDAELGTWATNFSALITANPTDFGLIAGDAVIIAAAVDPYVAALAVSTAPGTRTPVAIAAKDSAREAMRSVVMPYATRISQNAAVPEEDKTDVGVTNRSDIRTRNSVVGVSTEIRSRGYPAPDICRLLVGNPATPDSDARPLGALGWELQIMKYQEPWPTGATMVLDLTFTRPIGQVSYDMFSSTGIFFKCRTRWVGALLVGGALNVGPWSAWTEFAFVDLSGPIEE